jgi:hypothetical protein
MSISRAQLKALSRLRRKEAQLLFEAKLFDGAAYLVASVLESALKARICRVLDLDVYPDSGELRRVFGTHDLKQLLKLAGLERKLTATGGSVVASWTAILKRTSASGRAVSENELRSLLDAVDEVRKWIMKYW